MTPQRVVVLGATGSIGLSTLDVISRHPDRYQVQALSAHHRVRELADLCRQFKPRQAVVANDQDAELLRSLLGEEAACEILTGADALAAVASGPETDTVMAAIVGAAGLLPTLAAVRAGKRVLLANKEALVMSGQLFMTEVARHGATLLPIDSEHNAIFQCLPAGRRRDLATAGIEKLVLTASGGPFRGWTREQLAGVTPEQAVRHPNWSMGRKISVDSATLMNKGLEFIEACWLFDARPDQVDVVLHPQSIIHSMVRYQDGSVLAQLGNPDMRTPIAHALAWPERIVAGVDALDLALIGRLEFERPDTGAFPCLELARRAMQAGGSHPAVLNAANEVAVEAFLAHRLGFTAIARVISDVLAQMPVSGADDLATILAVDHEARERAHRLVGAAA